MPQNSSKYTGVTWDNRRQKWLAQVVIAGKCRCLGRYEHEEEAAKIVDNANFWLQSYSAKGIRPFNVATGPDAVGPMDPLIEELHQKLQEERAPTYKHWNADTPAKRFRNAQVDFKASAAKITEALRYAVEYCELDEEIRHFLRQLKAGEVKDPEVCAGYLLQKMGE